MTAIAICPTSLSFIFKSCLPAGSIGVGCTLNKTVKAIVQSGKKTSIFFNGKPIHFPTIEYALSPVTAKPTIVEIKSPLPLGYGFGVSAAATLASLFAVNKLFSLHEKRERLIKLAHIAEIKNKTGLGSVATQVTGGFLIKAAPGVPVTSVTKLPFVGKKLYAILIDRLETPSVLKNKAHLKRINKAAAEALQMIQSKSDIFLEDVIDIAYQFTYKSKLLTHPAVSSIIKKIKASGGHATMAILGQVVITTSKPNFPTNYQVEELIISDKTMLML
jgi:pantoate kinase